MIDVLLLEGEGVTDDEMAVAARLHRLKALAARNGGEFRVSVRRDSEEEMSISFHASACCDGQPIPFDSDRSRVMAREPDAEQSAAEAMIEHLDRMIEWFVENGS